MQSLVCLIGPSIQNQKDLFSFFDEVGFRTLYFQNEESFLSSQESTINLLLLDSTLQVSAIKRKWPSTPVLVLLGEGEEPFADSEDVFGYIQQPFRWSEIILSLQQALPAEGEIHSEIQVGDWIDFSLSSNRGIFQSMRTFLRNLLQFSTLPKELIYHIQHSICEILLNAMEHGNRFDPRKRVKGSYVLFHDRLIVKIEDQGCGFFPSSVPNPLNHPADVAETRKRQGKRPGGYGLALANRWMTLDYSDRGNTVLLTKVF